MNDLIFLLIALPTAYLLGSIPSAVWIGRSFYGIDVREHGSGNAGATNTLRVLGKKAGFLVLFIDCIKGLAAASLPLFNNNLTPGSEMFHIHQMACGMAAVLGHVFPVFAGFKGGKGIATLLGVVIGISWPVSLMCALTFVVIVWVTRYISVGSMLACSLSPLYVRIYHGYEPAFIYFCIAIAIMVIYTHRSNLKRLKEGNENRFSFNQGQKKEKNELVSENS
ncbi:MAG: glycerol-3-phosphate 1-O-acyltransferase PlsY [Bacteroidia bacterium]|nr:glycerol-3-phosphate 1-O-acyltransferase PlsY [Bacteroidia bacterium]